MNSGVTIGADVAQQWNTLRLDTNINYIKIAVVDEKFTILASGNSAEPAEYVQTLLKETEPCYILIRVPGDQEKFYLIFFVPMKCKIREKMIHSSSLNALKSGLGTDYLQNELYITMTSELTTSLLNKSEQKVDQRQVMTYTELLAEDSKKATIGLETQSRVSVDLLVTMTPSASTAFEKLQSGAANTVLFTVNPDNQDLEVIQTGTYQTMAQVQTLLTETQPCFIYMKYNHTNPETNESATKNILIYYCPNKAHVKLKMIYSSAKSELLKLLNAIPALARDYGFEASEAQEVSDDNTMKTIYPPSQQIIRVAKPVAPHLRRKQQQQQ